MLAEFLNRNSRELLNQGFKLFDLDFIPDEEFFFNPFDEGPFTLVLQPCGDCTILGNKVAPDFWKD